MKTTFTARFIRSAAAILLVLAVCLGLAPAARAGLTVDIHLYHDTYGYYAFPFLNANSTGPNFPDGNYLIISPQFPYSQLQYQATNGVLNYMGGGGSYYGDFDSFLYGITNGQWSIWVTNSISTNQYQFAVTVSGVTSNSFGAGRGGVSPQRCGECHQPAAIPMDGTNELGWRIKCERRLH